MIIFNYFVGDFLQFLQYSRGIFESCDPDVAADSSLEADENVMEFYTANESNAELSKLRLHSMLSFGKGVIFSACCLFISSLLLLLDNTLL